jgi:hypothetical protein
MRISTTLTTLCFFLINFGIVTYAQNTGAPSDSHQDGVNSQSSYLGGDHNIDPSDLANFTQLWNATFNPDEKVYTFSPYFHLIIALLQRSSQPIT